MYLHKSKLNYNWLNQNFKKHNIINNKKSKIDPPILF